ncbi:hypothetical protein O6H91_08G014800 [Diphasiastrum complanatum]|uniref:Uncharacterized protein n=1 Tax=Diphasiastrum complanatum TaxID=34168 RepID=A0ACC2CV44_DIPCM|nr:hypothetical protein O6H91_08G014800 [Diphasiastrum complanatum]
MQKVGNFGTGMGMLELNFSNCTQNRSLVAMYAGAAAVDMGVHVAESRQLTAYKASKKLGWCRIEAIQSIVISGDNGIHNKKKRKGSKGINGLNDGGMLSIDYGKASSRISTSFSSKKLKCFVGFSWHLCCYDEKATSHSEAHIDSNEEPFAEKIVSTSAAHTQKLQSQKENNNGKAGFYNIGSSHDNESGNRLEGIDYSFHDSNDNHDRSLDINSNRGAGACVDGYKVPKVLDEDEGSPRFGLQGRKCSSYISQVTPVISPEEGNGTQEVQLAEKGRVHQDVSERRCENQLHNEDCNTNSGVCDQKTGSGLLSLGYSTSSGEPVYEVLEVSLRGCITKKEISRRQLLKTSGLRLRDIRSVDPSLWITNSVPALLVRDHVILLNLGSLRAIATRESVLIFDHKSIGAQTFLEALRQRLTSENSGNHAMPFELEAVEAALISRTQRLEQTLMQIEPQVVSLLQILPNRLTADVLEELRISKQALVELSAKAGSLRQMLLELLEHPHDIRRMTIIGRTCHIRKEDGKTECFIPLDKQVAEDEEEEIEMLLENYLQRCESCHGQAQKLLDSAKEMEDSISVNLSARRLEVSRLELLLQVGTFCTALGALVAGIFGMNLRSYLEEHVFAFWITSAGILFGGLALFILMYTYLKQRRIL